MKRGESNRPQEGQEVHSPVAHHLQADAQSVPDQPSEAPGQIPPVDVLSMTLHGMEYPFGQLSSAVLAMLPHSFLCTSSPAELGTLKSP